MSTLTTNYSFIKNARGEFGWDVDQRANWDSLDGTLKAVSDEAANAVAAVALGAIASGTATSVGALTIGDTGATWAVDTFSAGYSVRYLSGGLDAVAAITSNTATQLTLATGAPAPDASTVYTVFANASVPSVVALSYLRGKADLSGWETRTPAQVLNDIGGSSARVVVSITDVGGTRVMTAAEVADGLFHCTGVLTSDLYLQLPAGTVADIDVQNDTTGDFGVYVEDSASTTNYECPRGMNWPIAANGTSITSPNSGQIIQTVVKKVPGGGGSYAAMTALQSQAITPRMKTSTMTGSFTGSCGTNSSTAGDIQNAQCTSDATGSDTVIRSYGSIAGNQDSTANTTQNSGMALGFSEIPAVLTAVTYKWWMSTSGGGYAYFPVGEGQITIEERAP